MKSYDNIIFDLGGILINLNYKKSLKAFSKIAGKNIESLYTEYKSNPLFDQFERGAITSSIFRKELKLLFDFEATADQIDNAWNAILGKIPKNRIQLVDQISKKKRTFILSNTNEIHKKAFDKIYMEQTAEKRLDTHFEKVYYSHLIKMNKPNSNIYDWVLKQNNLIANKTLFIDDSKENLLGAEKLGICTLLIDPKTSTILDYKDLLLT